jgi:hypothetical protein
MSLVLDLPPELESELAAEAARLQIPLSEYALRVLAGGGVAGPKPATGADLVVYWKREGLVGMRPEIVDAPQHARALRQRAEKRMR